jgi:hypothetical protein
MDANTWLSRQGSKGRQDSLPLTPDVFAAGAHAMTPGTVNVMLTPPGMTASTPAAAVAAPSPAAPLTVLLPRGARLLLRAARPTPVKEARPQQQQHHHSLEAWQIGLVVMLLLSAMIGAASYTLLHRHHQQPELTPPSTALVPYISPASLAGDWYLVSHQIYMPAFLRLPSSCSPPAAISDKGHHLALYGVCHGMELPLGRVEGLHPAVLPALRLDLPALASVARNSAAAVTRAVAQTRLPVADLCGLAAVAAAAVYCARCLMAWHLSSLAASSEAATPSQAACDHDDDWLADSEAEHVVASLPRQSSEDAHPVTPAHPRALSFSRAEEPLMDQGEATVKGGRRRRAVAPAVQAQGRRTRATAGRRE